jgi:hypothetical protein
MVKTVVRYHHWTPETVLNLYLDDTDFFGLIYWYNDVVQVLEELEKQ